MSRVRPTLRWAVPLTSCLALLAGAAGGARAGSVSPDDLPLEPPASTAQRNDNSALFDASYRDYYAADAAGTEPAGTATVGGKPAAKTSAPKKKRQNLKQAGGGAYKVLFFDNDFSYLRDPYYNQWHLGESLKALDVTPCLTIDAGGQYRARYHSEHNLRTKPLSGPSDDFLLHRTRLYLNARYADWLRFYGEAIDATSNFQRSTPRGIEVNRFDANNLFGDLKVWDDGCGQGWVRGGRQELLYGAQRFVSPLDWSNTRRTFDGVKAFYTSKTWDVDGWWTQPVPFGQHIAGGLQDHNFDSSNDDQEFTGLYATYKAAGQRKTDFYYLRLADYSGANRSFDSTINNGPSGDFDFNLFGTRLAGGRDRWLWELEGGYQFGRFGTDDIRAGAFTVGLGRKFPCALWKPTLWAYYDWASGDHNANDGRHGTFNQYFPLGHKYLGWMDIIGRQNIEDVNLLLVSQPREKIKFLIWYHVFFLQTARDGLYNAGGNQIYIDPTGNAGEDVGQELDLLVQWTWTPRTNIWFGYSHFFTGDYFDSPVIQAQGANGRDADFFYTQFTVNF